MSSKSEKELKMGVIDSIVKLYSRRGLDSAIVREYISKLIKNKVGRKRLYSNLNEMRKRPEYISDRVMIENLQQMFILLYPDVLK